MHRHRWGEVVRAAAEYFRALRETVRSDYEIAFDAHAKIFEVAQAAQLGNALAPYDPLFFEEPLRPENFEAWGELKRALDCTLATGESLYSRFEFLRLLQVRGCDIIQPDICVVGGLLEMRRIAALAEAHYVTVAPHNPMGPLATAVNVHFAAAQPNFRILEYRLPEGPGYAFGTGAGETAAANARQRALRERSVPAEGRLSRAAAGSRRLGRRDGHRAARHRGLCELAAQGADQAGWFDRVGVSGCLRRACRWPCYRYAGTRRREQGSFAARSRRSSMRPSIRLAGPNQVLRGTQRDVGTQPWECHAGRKGKQNKGSKQAIRLRIFCRRRLVEYGQHGEILLFE